MQNGGSAETAHTVVATVAIPGGADWHRCEQRFEHAGLPHDGTCCGSFSLCCYSEGMFLSRSPLDIAPTSNAISSMRCQEMRLDRIVARAKSGRDDDDSQVHTLGGVHSHPTLPLRPQEEQGFAFLLLLLACSLRGALTRAWQGSEGVVPSNPVSENESAAFLREGQQATSKTYESDTQHWMFLWFSELMVLSLGVSDFGSSLWYFLQLHVLQVPCSNFFAFIGFVFEPAGALLVTSVTISTLVLLRKSLVLQTRRQMKNTLTLLWIISNVVSWVLPIVMGSVFWYYGRLGSDQVYCWLKPSQELDSNAALLRVYIYYLPILLLLVANVVLMGVVGCEFSSCCFSLSTNLTHLLPHTDNNWKLKMGLTKLAMSWIPVSFFVVWVFPTIVTVWTTFVDLNPPFALQFLASFMLPAQGFLNAILFVILLGRRRKRIEHTVSRLGDTFDFAIDEMRISLFGETVTWYFNDDFAQI